MLGVTNLQPYCKCLDEPGKIYRCELAHTAGISYLESFLGWSWNWRNPVFWGGCLLFSLRLYLCSYGHSLVESSGAWLENGEAFEAMWSFWPGAEPPSGLSSRMLTQRSPLLHGLTAVGRVQYSVEIVEPQQAPYSPWWVLKQQDSYMIPAR